MFKYINNGAIIFSEKNFVFSAICCPYLSKNHRKGMVFVTPVSGNLNLNNRYVLYKFNDLFYGLKGEEITVAFTPKIPQPAIFNVK